MGWEKAVAVSDLPSGSRRVVKVGGQSVLLIHHEGEIYACQNACPHMGFPLSQGTLQEDCALECALHRSVFDLRTGDAKEWSPWPPVLGPGLGMLRRKRALQVWPTKVEDGHVWVELEEVTA